MGSPNRSDIALGIDVGARLLHCVAVDADGRVVAADAVEPDEVGKVAAWATTCETVAIDAPSKPSNRPHGDDVELSPKFREARCAEVELGRRHGIWVPWVTPAAPPFATWMTVGFAVYGALSNAHTVETYPYAVFRLLAGHKLARKQTLVGLRERIALLESAGLKAATMSLWTHNAIDAAGAALVAWSVARGEAIPIGCGHDDSAIWLPGSVTTRGISAE
jgi:predicted nuclease with RNAse H fold